MLINTESEVIRNQLAEMGRVDKILSGNLVVKYSADLKFGDLFINEGRVVRYVTHNITTIQYYDILFGTFGKLYRDLRKKEPHKVVGVEFFDNSGFEVDPFRVRYCKINECYAGDLVLWNGWQEVLSVSKYKVDLKLENIRYRGNQKVDKVLCISCGKLNDLQKLQQEYDRLDKMYNELLCKFNNMINDSNAVE